MTTRSDKPKAKTRFQQVCPRRLNCLPTEACPMALERLRALKNQTDKKLKEGEILKGCAWYCDSSDANYCFFSQVSADPGPYADEDISSLLAIPTSQVLKTYESGIANLKALKDTDLLKEMKEMGQEMANKHSDNTVYLPDHFRDDHKTLPASITSESQEDTDASAADELEETSKQVKSTKPPKKNHMYGLYSLETLKRIKREEDAAHAKLKKDNKKN